MTRLDGPCIYRRLLRLLPRSFRLEAEPDLLAVFTASYARIRSRGAPRRLLFWLVIVIDLVATAIAERRPGRRRAPFMVRTALAALVYDLRFTVRRLVHRPGWTAVGAGTLAVGLAAAIVATVLVRDVLLRPLPFPESDRLVRIIELSDNGRGWWPSFPNASDWRARARFFDGVGIADIPAVRPVEVGRTAIRVSVSRAARGLFETLRVEPRTGRLFTAAENAPGGAPVAIVSDAFWRGPLASQPVGSIALGLRGRQYTVVGVLPADFRFLGDGGAWSLPADVWTPMDQDADLGGRTSHGYHVVARLGAGVTLTQARREMNALVARLKTDNLEPTNADAALLRPLRDVVVRQAEAPLRWLLYASFAVLLVSCLNLAASILAQGLHRARELSIRMALGASRVRLVWHLLADAMGLALPAVGAGLLLAAAGLGALRAWAGTSLPRLDEAGLDATAVGAAVVTALVAALAAGVVPALVLASRPFVERLRTHGASSSGHRRVWPAFIVGQVAMSMLLLTGTGLLVRSFVAAITVDLGYDPRHVLAVDVTLPEPAYADDARKIAYYDRALTALRGVPGIVSAGLTSVLPQETSAVTSDTRRDGQEAPHTFAGYRLVDPEYFTTLRIPRLHVDARAFEAGGALVDRTLQDALWRGGNPVGGRFANGFANGVLTDVGVVGTVREWDQDTDTIGAIYVDFHQRPAMVGTMHFVVRYAGSEALAVDAMRRTLASVDPRVPITIAPLDERATASLAGRKILVIVAAVFGGIAVLLASAGVYALVAFVVARSAKEAAIRLALGALPNAVRRRAAGAGVIPALVGIACGAVGSAWLGGALRGQLFHVRPHDPVVLVTAAGFAMAAAWLAARIPARRASQVDPAATLRSDV